MRRGVLVVTVALAAFGTAPLPGTALADPTPASIPVDSHWSSATLPFSTAGPSALENPSAVSCASATLCLAVGGDAVGDEENGPNRGIAYVVNGSHVSLRTLSARTGPASVSCVRGTTTCYLVGQSAFDTYANGSWSAATVPHAVRTPALSCPAVGTCTLLGTPSGSGSSIEVQTLSNGTWTDQILALPNSPSYPNVGAASCPAVGECHAVVLGQSPGGYDYLADLSNGAWSFTPAPAPAGALQPLLLGEDCPTPGACTAVGSYLDSAYARHALVETLAGGSWTASTPDVGSGTSFSGLSCPTTTQCEALTQDSAGTMGSSSEVAGSWGSPKPIPVPAGASGLAVAALACASSTDCVSFGAALAANRTSFQLDRLAAGAWAGLGTPAVPAPPAASLSAVACASTTSCLAVGRYADSGQAPHLFAETGHGTSWTRTELPTPPVPSLVGTSCPQADACYVLMNSTDRSTGQSSVVLDTQSGGTWTQSTVPVPANGQATGFSCPAVGACTVTGSAFSFTTYTYSYFFETLSAGSWTTTPVPAPAGATGAQYVRMVCRTAALCYAGGSATDSTSHTRAVLATLYHGTWSAGFAPTPPSSQASSIGSMSCPATGACTATGYWYDGTTSHLLAFHFGAGHLVAVNPQLIDSIHNYMLSAVSCASATSCVVTVGVPAGEGLTARTMVLETLSGTTWTPTRVSPPAGSSNVGFAGVSCPAVGSCTAVGGAVGTNLGDYPLVGTLGT